MDKTKEERQNEVKGALKGALLEIEDEEWKVYQGKVKKHKVAYAEWQEKCKKSNDLMAHHRIPCPRHPPAPKSLFSPVVFPSRPISSAPGRIH